MKKVFFVAVLLMLAAVFNLSTVKTQAEPVNPINEITQISEPAEPTLGTLTTGDVEVDSYIVKSCARYKIDPLLIYAQMHQESKFKVKATSGKGASGLMQLMPDTARRFGVTNIYDQEENVEAGVKYMRWLLDKFDGNVQLALAGYNAGEGAVMKYDYQIPPYRETQDYVAKITAHYQKIKTSNSIPNIPGINTISQEIAKVM